MDYPCSNMKEFETIVGVTKSLLQQLTGTSTPIKVKRIDEGGIDGDLCAVVTAGDKQAVAVVWPTAEKLKQIKQLAEVSLQLKVLHVRIQQTHVCWSAHIGRLHG
jgi:hypothetical protein